MKRLLFLIIITIITNSSLLAYNIVPNDTIIYKKTTDRYLPMYIFYPPHNTANNRTAILHFFGGGWMGGTPSQFYQQCSYLASKGYVTITADYRVMKTKGITPFDCVEDARSAIRFVRENAEKLRIDPNKIIASGGSAGGHLALCTAVCKPVFPEKVSSVPNGLILYNPVLDTTTDGYGTHRFTGNELLLSPNHHIHAGIPPTIIFHGTDDQTVPFENARKFSALMKTYGNPCHLIPFKGKDHGFFNGSYFRKSNGDADFNHCMDKVEQFLKRYDFSEDKKLSSDNYHNFRNLLINSTRTFQNTKKGRVAFLGGSITYNKGWRNEVCKYLQNKFPETSFDFIAAGIPSHGSTSAAFRLERDVLSKGDIDLIFVEAAVNDRSPALQCNSVRRVRGMEGIIRHIKQTNPNTDIVMMHFVDQHKMADYSMEVIPQEIMDHEKVAEHYHISSINLAKEVAERIENGEFDWIHDFKNIHPSPFGQIIYSNSIKRFLDRNLLFIKDKTAETYQVPEKLDPFCYDEGHFISSDKITNAIGFKVDGTDKSDNRNNVKCLHADKPGNSFSLSFEGNSIGVVALPGQDAGMIEYTIDDKPTRIFDLFTTNSWLQYTISRYYILDDELDNGPHTLKIKISDQKNVYSKGHNCSITEFLVN